MPKKGRDSETELRLVVEKLVDPEELRDAAQISADWEEFKETVYHYVITRAEWGWEGITAGWDLLDDWFKSMYEEYTAEKRVPPARPPARRRPRRREVRPPTFREFRRRRRRR
ncbi:MAG: hypothetical protein ACP5KE_06615 [Candidatus Methanodesulfokora sp.]|jgi:hypothetical protein